MEEEINFPINIILVDSILNLSSCATELAHQRLVVHSLEEMF